MIIVVAGTQAMSYINYRPVSPSEILMSKITLNISLYAPFLSLFLAYLGLKEKGRSQTLGYVAIGISLFTLSTVGFAYMLSAIF